MYKFPHCDQSVLHSPGECDYCDMPEFEPLHAERRAGKINYTGKTEVGKRFPCPSEKRRSLSNINKWYGNVPHKESK